MVDILRKKKVWVELGKSLGTPCNIVAQPFAHTSAHQVTVSIQATLYHGRISSAFNCSTDYSAPAFALHPVLRLSGVARMNM